MPRSAPFRSFLPLFALALVFLLAAAGCGGGKKDTEAFLEKEGSVEGPLLEQPVVPTRLEVSPEVARAWKAVVLEVTDKESKKVENFTLAIGETAPLGKTGLTAFVEGFLPTFTMAGDAFTSPSNQLDNPAARVKITDKDGKQLFYSFLFALYPTTHPFEHPRFAVILKDYKKS